MIATSEAKALATSLTAAELDIEREDGHRTLTHDGTGDTHTAPHSAQLVRDAISVVGQQVTSC